MNKIRLDIHPDTAHLLENSQVASVYASTATAEAADRVRDDLRHLRAQIDKTLEELGPSEDGEPSHDDTVLACPDCNTPNQFGEQCERCRREDDEYYHDNKEDR